MKFKIATLGLVAALVAASGVASADTLYVAAPPAQAPGHPLRLGPDHRASQVGDLLEIQFNFNVNTASSDVSQDGKGYNVNLGAGSGNLAQSILRFPTGIGGTTAAQSSKTRNGANSFVSAMMATVTNVLPSGALVVAGDQGLNINGQNQTLHVTGIVRPEDIDSTDTVLSTRIANVQAKFNGDFQEKNKGIIRRVLDFLF